MWNEGMRILLAFDTPCEIVCLLDLIALTMAFYCVGHGPNISLQEDGC